MPSKNTKIISLRIPERVNFEGISVSKLVTSLYDLYRIDAVRIEDSELIVPENDGLGDELRDIAHDLNIDPWDLLKKIRQWR